MKITYKGDYALKTVLDLALRYPGGPVPIHDIAKRLDIPVKFLELILLDLKRGGFVESKRGKIGGYFLAKEPSKITLAEVIRFIGTETEPIACVKDSYRGCSQMDTCVFREVWKQISKATEDIINNVTFEDLVRKNKNLSAVFSYQI